MALRVVFLGNSESVFSNRHFQALLDTPCQVLAVVDVPPDKRSSTNARAQTGLPRFVEAARAAGIPAFEPRSPNLPEFVAAISGVSPDVLMSVGYTNLLKERALALPRIVAANFHASLLPAYRGKHPVFWALRNGERSTGLTVHVMGAGLDTGDILYQVRARTRKDDSVGTLYDRIMACSLPLVGRLIEDAEWGRLRPRPQPTAGASYYSSVSDDDYRLDWSWEAEKLRRRITATPGRCFSEAAGRRISFMDAEVVDPVSGASPGRVVHLGRISATIAAGTRAIRARRARLPNGETVPLADLCRTLDLKCL